MIESDCAKSGSSTTFTIQMPAAMRASLQEEATRKGISLGRAIRERLLAPSQELVELRRRLAELEAANAKAEAGLEQAQTLLLRYNRLLSAGGVSS